MSSNSSIGNQKKQGISADDLVNDILAKRVEELKIKRPVIEDKDIDLSALKKICNEFLDFCESEDYCDDNDFQVYIFEEALQTFFGQDIFKYIRQVTTDPRYNL